VVEGLDEHALPDPAEIVNDGDDFAPEDRVLGLKDELPDVLLKVVQLLSGDVVVVAVDGGDAAVRRAVRLVLIERVLIPHPCVSWIVQVGVAVYLVDRAGRDGALRGRRSAEHYHQVPVAA